MRHILRLVALFSHFEYCTLLVLTTDVWLKAIFQQKLKKKHAFR